MKYNLPEIGLVFGAVIGAGLGIAVNNELMPVTAGIGCAVGLISGAVLQAIWQRKSCGR
jgi:uncharacterized protein YqgC (DUF456 family)